MSVITSYHPECRTDENFVGNHDIHKYKGLGEHLQELKTARLGETAYDLDGNRIPDPEVIAPYSNVLRPLFIGDAEFWLYDAIMCARTWPEDRNHTERLAALRAKHRQQ